VASSSPEAQAIDATAFGAQAADPGAFRRMLIRAQVLLDRAANRPPLRLTAH
jgi:hypothetical protein